MPEENIKMVKDESSDIRDEIPSTLEDETNKTLINRSHEYWFKIVLTVISLSIAVLFSLAFLKFAFMPGHTAFDIPVVLALSIVPTTLLVALMRYYYPVESRRKKVKKDEEPIIPQIDILKQVVSIINDLKK